MSSVLAIDGGAPVRTAPMPRWPSPGDAEVAAATQVLRSGLLNYWTGTQGKRLETEYAASLGRAHGIALANGTLALELGLRAFGVGPGDEVIVPARTYIATASAAVAVGATPVVSDIDPHSNNVTADTILAALTERTRAIIPVHLGGWPVDMEPIVRLAEERDLVVIEDCAQAHGATRNGRPVGALGSHAAAFSFCQDKIVPSGDAGLLVLDDQDAYERAWEYKDHGKSYGKVHDPGFTGAGTSFRWLVDSFGSNWRMDEMSAAVVRVGLSRLEEWHLTRARNAFRLAEGLRDLEAIDVHTPAAGSEHGYYRLYAHIRPEALAAGWDRDRITAAISAEGTPVQYGACAEIYREDAFATMGLGPPARLPGALAAHETSLAFFAHPTLEPSDIDDTVRAVRKVLAVATL